ncbi:MAG: type II CAAX endopeptidase family protein [Candidatus Eisenbacteria bacterium]
MTPLGILATFLVPLASGLIAPFGGLLVLVWARITNTPWAELGFRRPRNWWAEVVVGILFGAGLKLAMKAVIMPLLGAPPKNAYYGYLAGNTAALPWTVFVILVGAGFSEETLFRGFLFERFREWFGDRRGSLALIVLLTSTLFGAAHYPGQGWPGVQQAFVVGLVFGTIYAITRRIGFVMIAHAAFDLVAVALIYWGLESTVAGWIFH